MIFFHIHRPSIIPQIGRENKFSAEIFVLANSPLRITEKMNMSFQYDLLYRRYAKAVCFLLFADLSIALGTIPSLG